MPYPYSIGTLGTNRYPYATGFIKIIGKETGYLNFTDFFFRAEKTAGSESLSTFSHNTFAELDFAVFIFKKRNICVIENNAKQNQGNKEDKPRKIGKQKASSN